MIAPWDPNLSLDELRDRLDQMENTLRATGRRSEWLGFLVAVIFWISGLIAGGLIVLVWTLL